jgi:hypothetical protein
MFLNDGKDDQIELDQLAQFLRLAAILVAQGFEPFLLPLDTSLTRTLPRHQGGFEHAGTAAHDLVRLR